MFHESLFQVRTAQAEIASSDSESDIRLRTVRHVEIPSFGLSLGFLRRITSHDESHLDISRNLVNYHFWKSLYCKTPITPTPIIATPTISTPIVTTPIISTPIVTIPIIATPIISTPITSTLILSILD